MKNVKRLLIINYHKPMENKTLDLLGYDPDEAKSELEAIDEAIKYADDSNEKEFVEAGLPYVKLSKPLPNYKFK